MARKKPAPPPPAPLKPSRVPKRTLVKSINTWMLLLAGILIAFQALIANDQVSNGRRLSQLQQERDVLRQEVDSLQHQADAVSSLSYIRQYAQERLGLEPIQKNIRYIQPEPQ
jgi:cell division protein FtsB